MPRLRQSTGVDVVFAPTAGEMYPADSPPGSEPGGGRSSRAPTGPAISAASQCVCLKLFNLVRPQIAWFGRKDAQQVAVVKQLVRDLNVPIDVRVVETHGISTELAFSSRNALLSDEGGPHARFRARRTATRPRRVSPLGGCRADYVEVADFDGPTSSSPLESARRG
jgi:pantoate--beta-alanine ligase